MKNNNSLLPILRLRAEILTKIRIFFAQRQVLEVETPLLATSSVTDPHLHSLHTLQHLPGNKTGKKLYLQTSPEFAMKRLLASGSGSIYQICKAFRDEESGRYHNPEFTILEWYRVGFNHHDLMNEMDELLNYLLNTLPAERLTYREVFTKYLDIDPLTTPLDALKNCAIQNGLELSHELMADACRDTWLNTLLTHFIEPYLGNAEYTPTFIYDFPASQAALAKIRNDSPQVAERFEVYIKGIELANGFHELTDAALQRERFDLDLKKRAELGLPAIPIDENFLSALKMGMPNSAGVALGLDRLLMLANGSDAIATVMN